jgi:hypothetical protein
MEWVGLDFSGSGQEQVAGFCEYGNEHLGVTKYGNVLYWLRNFQLLKTVSAACA